MSPTNLSRRSMMTAAATIAAVPAVALGSAVLPETVIAAPVRLPAVAAIAVESDPIFAALAEHRRLYAKWARVSGQLDEAEGKCKEQCPCPLVSWRGYTAIGYSEIERARDEFLALPGVNTETIEREYREVKAAERAKRRAMRQWYRRNGLADLKANAEGAIEAERRAMWVLTRIRPTTAAGAGALIAHVLHDLKIGEHPWQLSALANVAAALKSMGVSPAREAVQS